MRSLISMDFPAPENGTWKRTCGISCLRSLAPMRRLQSTTHATFTNPSLLRFFCARARCLSAGLRYLRLTRLPRHDRGPVPGGNRSAASCPCTVLRRASYHYATRSPQSVATPRYSATPWYVLIQLANVIDTISKRWWSKKAFIHLPISSLSRFLLHPVLN